MNRSKKIFLFFFLSIFLLSCSKKVEVIKGNLSQDLPIREDVSIDVVTKTVEKTLQETFNNVPLKYCSDFMREPVLIYDEENYYMRTGTDLSQGGSNPSYDYCVFSVFKNTSGGNDVYAIEKATVTPMYIFGGIEFLEFNNGEWIEVKDKVFAEVDSEDLAKRGADSIQKYTPELAGDGLEGNHYVEIPRYGTTLKFIQYNTKEVIYELKWNGSDFIDVDLDS